MSKIVGSAWRRTNDKLCHAPIFDINCRYCKGKMFLRFSEIDLDDKNTAHTKTYLNRLAYKCPDCGWIARFDLEDDAGYFFDVLKMRGGSSHYQPDSDEWGRESEDVAKQLAALGYIGGREA